MLPNWLNPVDRPLRLLQSYVENKASWRRSAQRWTAEENKQRTNMLSMWVTPWLPELSWCGRLCRRRVFKGWGLGNILLISTRFLFIYLLWIILGFHGCAGFSLAVGSRGRSFSWSSGCSLGGFACRARALGHQVEHQGFCSAALGLSSCGA